MKKIFKKMFFASLLAPCIVNAQMDNLKDVSSEWQRTINRNAATSSAEAVIYNPAGIVELGDGIHLNIGNQTLIRHPKQNYKAFATGQDVEKSHKGIDYFVPNIYVAFVKNNWAISTGIYVAGGGGSANFPDGSVSTDKILFGPNFANIKKGKILKSVTHEMEGSSFHIAIPLIFTYKINEKISAALGGRLIYGTKWNKASADIKYKTGTDTIPKGDATQSGYGFGGILGIDYKPTKDFLISLTYETITKLTYETDVKNDNTGIFKDGEKLKRDLSPVLRLGLSYKPIEKLTLLSDVNYYFQTQADWEYKKDSTSLSKYAGDAIAIGLGADYQLTDKLLIGCGFSYTDYMFKDINKYYTQATGAYETIKNDNLTTGIGLSYKITDKMSFNIAYSFIYYIEDTIIDQDMLKISKIPQNPFNINPEVKIDNWASGIALGLNIKL